MRRRALFIAALLLPGAAIAQPETRLRLSESGTARREPDEVLAVLRFEARNVQVAQAQAAVNRAIAGALEAARTVPGVTVSTGSPQTQRPELGREWVASQRVTLRGAEPVALLDLAGRFQQSGFGLVDLLWRLTDEPMREAHEAAVIDGLRQLRARAALVAEELGLQVDQIREISLDPAPEQARALSASYSSREAPPRLTREEIVVTARVAAEIILIPR